MELSTMDRAELRRVYREHVKRDFPPQERKPLFVMERLARQGKYDTLGVYDSGALLAYAFLWHDGRRDCALLDYLAVCGGGRGKGTGTAVLKLLGSRYRDYGSILVEAEAPDAGAPEKENALRLRRQAFYLRAGYRSLDYRAKLFGVMYDMFASGETNREAAMEAHRRLYCGDPYAQRSRFVDIPCEES